MKVNIKDIELIAELENTHDREIPAPSAIVKCLDEYVIDQVDAKKALALMYVNHLAKLQNNLSTLKTMDIGSNVLLLTGPSGSGKTHLIRALSKITDLPIQIEDASQFTSAGYVGRNAQDMLLSLIQRADNDIQLAQKGIIFIDEIDKIASSYTTAEVRGISIQLEMLKIIEGTKINLEADQKSSMRGVKDLQFDTSNILFILGGAFAKLTDTTGTTLGFSEQDTMTERVLKPQDILKFGFIKEFVGRITQISAVTKLSKEALRRVFTEPKDALLKQYECLFDIRGIKYKITEEDIDHIVDEADKLAIGARSLKQVADTFLRDKTFN